MAHRQRATAANDVDAPMTATQPNGQTEERKRGGGGGEGELGSFMAKNANVTDGAGCGQRAEGRG